MKPATAEKLAWVLIYSGLLLAVVGAFVLRLGSVWGGAVIGVGLLDAAVGAGLIWWRSKMDKETSR